MATINIPAPPEMVTVTVNGEDMKLPKGKNLLQALLDVGHYIPHYCYHPRLSVAGNCRLCLIEIEGRPKPEISCNMIVTDGLKIKTNSELVEDCRKGMMEFLLVNHPLDCPICDRGGECMLQRYSMDYGWGTARTTDDRRRFKKPQFDPLIDIERNRCIMCTRCTRFCDEVAGEHVMGVFGHGNRNYIGTYGDGPVSNVFSGNVIDLCPVGCLTSKPFRFKARVWELRQTQTTTRTCNGPVTAWTRGDDLYRVTPPVRHRKDHFTVDEDTIQFISNEARFGSLHVNNPERLTRPQVRVDGQLKDASWDAALDRVVAALKACKPGESAFLAGERSTNEEAYMLGRLARSVCKSPYVDWRSRFASDAAAHWAGHAMQASNGDFDLLDAGAYEAMLVINATDLLGSAPDIALRLKEAARLERTRLGLLDLRIDPWMAPHAETAFLEQPEDLSIMVQNLAAALGSGEDKPEDIDDFKGLFELLRSARQGLVVLGLDGSGGALNPALVPAALRLMKALGDRWHFLPVTAARNAKGCFASGAQSDRLPTGAIENAEAVKATEALWGNTIEPMDQPPAAPGILQLAAQGRFKVLMLNRCDELVTHPRRELVTQALRNSELVVALDVFPSWITDLADIVLPGSFFYESNGSMTEIDGTLSRMSQGRRPKGEAQEEWRIIESIANLMGDTRRFGKANEIFEELGKAWDAPKGMRLDDLLLPGPGELTPQVHHLYTQRTRPDFKLHCNDAPDPETEPDATPPEDLRTYGLRMAWINHAQGPDHLSSRSSEFDALRPRPRIELNPEDAQGLELGDGDWVVLEGGSAEPSRLLLNPNLAPGIAFGAANVLGLTFGGEAEGLPTIRLRKTEPPKDAPTGVEQPEHVEVKL